MIENLEQLTDIELDEAIALTGVYDIWKYTQLCAERDRRKQ